MTLIFACPPRVFRLQKSIPFPKRNCGRWFELLLEPNHCCFTRSATSGRGFFFNIWVYPQWFCWSLSLWKMAISLGIYPIFRHTQGVSENVVYPNQPNGFADHKIPMKNGYFIGNIPYFQTHPYLMHSDTQKPAVKLWSDLIVTSMRPQANGRSTPWNSWSRPTYQGAETYGLFTLFTPQFVGVWRVWVINGTGSMQRFSSHLFLFIHWYPRFEPYPPCFWLLDGDIPQVLNGTSVFFHRYWSYPHPVKSPSFQWLKVT